MTPPISSSVPIDAVVLPALPAMPAGGGDFAGMLDICAETAAPPAPPTSGAPVPEIPGQAQLPASTPGVVIAEAVATVVSLAASPKSWNLDPVQMDADVAETDIDAGDDDEIQADDASVSEEAAPVAVLPPEILGLAVNLPAPAPEPETRHGRASFFRSGSARSVTDIPLHSPVAVAKATPAPAAAAVPAALVAPVAEAPASSVVDPVAPGSRAPRADTVAIPDAPVSRADSAVASVLTEKFAAVAKPIPESTVPSAGERVNNKFLKIDKQMDANPVKSHGIGRAKSEADMQATPEPIPVQTSFAQPRAGVMNEAGVPVVVQASDSSAVTRSHTPSAELAGRREISLPVTDAGAVVREVAELTHDFRMRERSSVEVKFNFKDETELSVRLAYRDGDVHTTFRTDSEDLRAALGREWQGYAANVAQEPRGYRIADPVFTSSNSFSDSAQGRDSGSAADGDPRNRQQSAQPDQPDARGAGAHAHGFRPSTPALGHRVSSDRLLHAFA